MYARRVAWVSHALGLGIAKSRRAAKKKANSNTKWSVLLPVIHLSGLCRKTLPDSIYGTCHLGLLFSYVFIYLFYFLIVEGWLYTNFRGSQLSIKSPRWISTPRELSCFARVMTTARSVSGLLVKMHLLVFLGKDSKPFFIYFSSFLWAVKRLKHKQISFGIRVALPMWGKNTRP